MNSSKTKKLSPKGFVTPVHSRVRGRVRFDVQGLYRSPSLKQRLERGLIETHRGIRRAEANVLTGRLLVMHSSEISISGIIASIEDLVGVVPPQSESFSRRRRGEGALRARTKASELCGLQCLERTWGLASWLLDDVADARQPLRSVPRSVRRRCPNEPSARRTFSLGTSWMPAGCLLHSSRPINRA